MESLTAWSWLDTSGVCDGWSVFVSEPTSIDALLPSHRAFWSMDEADTALTRPGPFRPLGSGGHDGRYLPGIEEGDPIRPEALDFEAVLSSAPPTAIDSPFLEGIHLPGVCWTEALTGCPVRMETGGAWADPFLLDRPSVRKWCARVDRWDAGPWAAAFREGMAVLAAGVEGRLPLTQTLMRGPLDMMAAALGHEAMVDLCIEEQGLAREFLDRCAELFIALGREHLALRPTFHGGDVSYGIWSSLPVIRTQLDNAVLLSPTLYREVALPADTRIFRAFERTIMHVHSGCLHIIDELLAAPDLTGIQVSIDHPGGPLAGEILPILSRMCRRKPLIVTGPATSEEMVKMQSRLGAAGVALDLQVIE